ncbi:hypothetical protein D4764_16G0004230 [Takifugu flavidus]|uniref:Uncharacterized protein n=1 Tax=Takifugu flavidus TaxID=433684 RepID=A0A5C6NYH4_9TELE|nr:hypothetical protein D4764_16G0004230 [Takifugu flavidus]
MPLWADLAANYSPALGREVRPWKMDLRVASIVLLMAALAAAHGKGYVVKKVVKAPPQYQPYSVKSQGDLQLPSELHLWSSDWLYEAYPADFEEICAVIFSKDIFKWCQWQVNLVLQVSLALRDQLVPLAHQVTVPKVCLDPKDLLDPLVLLDAPLLANLDPQVGLANQAFLEHMVRRETLEPLVLRDQGEPLDLLEAPDQLASLLLASLGLLVFPELWDPEESLDIKDTQVFLDCQVLRVIEGWELLDLRVRQDLKGLWDQLEHLVHLELESQENQVQLVSQESQVAQVEMVPLVLWDQWDPRATLVPQV